MKALGIDVGGTFTDFVLFDSASERVWLLKESSSEDQAAVVVDGIGKLSELAGIDPTEIDLLIHGTTVATNSLLEYDGAATGLITTRGFRDLLHMGRHQRPQNYSIQQDIPDDKKSAKRMPFETERQRIREVTAWLKSAASTDLADHAQGNDDGTLSFSKVG